MRRYGGHYKMNGAPVNVPATLDHVLGVLPRMPNQLQLHPVKLKRRIQYKSRYMYDMVHRDKIIGALPWLKQHNTHYTCICVNADWMCLFNICGYHENMTNLAQHNTPDNESNNRQRHNISCTVSKHTSNDLCQHVCVSQDTDCHNHNDANMDALPSDLGENSGNKMTSDEDKILDEDQAAVDRQQELTGDDMPSVVQIDNIENHIYQCAPGQNNTPQYLLLDDNFEVLPFPDLFPYGYGGYFSSNRTMKLGICKYFQQRLLNVDGQFAQNMEYIFCAQYISDIKQIQSDANMAIHLSHGCTLDGNKITAGALHNPHVLQRLVQNQEAYKFLKNV